MSCFSCYLSHIARIVMCASCLLVHGCNKERVRAAALASVRKRLQRLGRRSVHEYMAAEHWQAKQVLRGQPDVFFVDWCHISVTQRCRTSGAAWSGARRCSSGSISQDTHFSQVQWTLFSLFHPALQTIISMRFPVVFRSESRGVFLVVLVVWCCLPRKICTMFLSLLSCSRPITHGDDALASSRQLLQKCSSATSSGRTSPFSGCASSPTIRTRGSVGASHISQLSWHMSFSQPSARAQHCHPSLQLNVESCFRHIF